MSPCYEGSSIFDRISPKLPGNVWIILKKLLDYLLGYTYNSPKVCPSVRITKALPFWFRF